MAQHLVYTKLLSRYYINFELTLNPNPGRFGHGAELRLRHCRERAMLEQRTNGFTSLATAAVLMETDARTRFFVVTENGLNTLNPHRRP